jgi:hypothetical protein
MIDEQQAISIHLGNIQKEPGYTRFSGFMAALRDARKFTKRDQDTGAKLLDDTCGDHGSWLGAIGYLTLLDQIGGCFKPQGVNHVSGNTIVKALRYFGGLNEVEANAIYALRCSLAHDFGAFNINSHKPGLTHLFTLHQDPSFPLLHFPKTPWDGNINTFNRDNVTYVNLRALGDLVEAIYKELLTLAANSNLVIILPGGVMELCIKYSYWTPNASQ